MKLVQEGDIIELRPGHCVYLRLPAHFVFSNRFGDFEEMAETEVVVGKPKGGLDTTFLEGRYVVVATAMTGGGTGMGPHDVYPDGHHVIAQRLMSTDIGMSAPSMSPDHPLRVSFYQSGCFTAMIPDPPVVGRARATWSE